MEMTDFEKGYEAYWTLEPEEVVGFSDQFQKGYWQADNEVLQAKDDQERWYFERNEENE